MEIQQYHLWNKLTQNNLPLSFDLELTARCNLNCRHCYINLPAEDMQAKEEELSAAEIMNIASSAVDMGAMWCLITGGEPLLRKDFADIYLGLKRMGLLVSVFTNATLINREHVRLFKKFPPRDIEVTVYGVTRKTMEEVTRTTGSFECFLRALNELRANGLPVRFKTMAVRSNFHEQQEIAGFCRGWTKDYFRFDSQLHLRFDGDLNRNQDIKSERLNPEQVAGLDLTDDKRVTALLKECAEMESSGHDSGRLLLCSAGRGSFTVSCDGRLKLCSSLCAEGTTYDLKNGNLKEAWNDFVPHVRKLSLPHSESIKTCRECSLVNLCLWCPAHAHLETGRFDCPTPYFCQVAHKRAESIKKVAANNF